MSDKFNTGVRFNHQLGVLETWSFLGEGVGAALYIIAVVTGRLPMGAVGVLFVLGAVAVLRAHLGQPRRGWRALSRLGTSWVSRGTLVIACFTGLATLSVAAAYVALLAPFRAVLTVAALVFAIPVIVYAGMLLRSMRAIRLWRGPFVPLAFSAHSAATGLTLAWALAPWLFRDVTSVEWLLSGAVGCLVVAAVMSAAHLLRVERSAGTRASLHRLLAGDLGRTFLWGAGVLGIAVPIAGLLGSRVSTGGTEGVATTLILALVALARLYGDFAYRKSIVLAGAYEPIFPSQPFRPSCGGIAGKAAVPGV